VGFAPYILLRDRDASYGSVFSEQVEVMGMTEVVTAPRSPWQNDYVEPVIGLSGRECVDHVIMFGEAHLRRVLSAYASYDSQIRTHPSLDKDAPGFRRAQPGGNISAKPLQGGLHHQYVQV